MTETDWIARQGPLRGCIDFRLPGDGADIPSHVLRTRILQYYRQVAAAAKANEGAPVQSSFL